MMRTTFSVPTAAVMVGCGVALAVAGLIGWHLGAGPAEPSHQSGTPQAAQPPDRAAPVAGTHAHHPDETPASEFDRERERLQKRFDEIQERMARAETLMPPIRERQAPQPEEQWEALEAKSRERDFLSRPIYIKPVPLQ